MRRETSISPPKPPTGVAKLHSASRRYRGLHLVLEEGLPKVPRHLNRLAQTKAIVDQVQREIAQGVAGKTNEELMLLSPVNLKASLPVRAARRVAALLPV